MALNCRFYRHKYPKLEDVVMVNVRSIAEMGAYVSLQEYGGIEGMIMLSELTRRRIRSINKLVRIGRSECVAVIRVDEEKGYIDLSKRRVSTEEIQKCEEKYSKAKTINSILSNVARKLDYTNEQLESLYDRTAWKFEDKTGISGSSYEVFKKVVTDPSILDECTLTEEEKENLLTNIQHRLTPQPVKIRSDIEVCCYSYEGIDAVKVALKTGLSRSTEEMPIKINLIAPPQYVVTTTTLDRAEGIAQLNSVLQVIRDCIESNDGGSFNVKMEPRVVSDVEDEELRLQMEELRLKNLEVAGDDDISDEDDAGLENDEGGSKEVVDS